MGSTVIHPGGMSDAEFQGYANLLRLKGADLAKLPRVLDPSTRKRWLYVWPTRAEAEAFAETMQELTQDPSWQVVQVDAVASEGPLGPVMVQRWKHALGMELSVHPLSSSILRSVATKAPPTTRAFVDWDTWEDYQKTRGNMRVLVEGLLPTLTGLTPGQLKELGFTVVEVEGDTELVAVPPQVSGT
jgi:hypothetical protein